MKSRDRATVGRDGEAPGAFLETLAVLVILLATLVDLAMETRILEWKMVGVCKGEEKKNCGGEME